MKPYSSTTLAQRWQCSKQTILNMIENGDIANTFKVGNMYRIPAWEVDRIEKCGSLKFTEKNTAPEKAREQTQLDGRLEPPMWMWQNSDSDNSSNTKDLKN